MESEHDVLGPCWIVFAYNGWPPGALGSGCGYQAGITVKGIDVFIGVSATLVAALMVFIVYRVRSDNAPVSRHSPQSAGKIFSRRVQPLPAGYKCSEADGYVYRYKYLPGGVTKVEWVRRKGELVRCGGYPRSSHRQENRGQALRFFHQSSLSINRLLADSGSECTSC